MSILKPARSVPNWPGGELPPSVSEPPRGRLSLSVPELPGAGLPSFEPKPPADGLFVCLLVSKIT